MNNGLNVSNDQKRVGNVKKKKDLKDELVEKRRKELHELLSKKLERTTNKENPSIRGKERGNNTTADGGSSSNSSSCNVNGRVGGGVRG